MLSLRTLPDRPVSVNPQFARFLVVSPSRANKAGSTPDGTGVRGGRCRPEGGLVLAQSSNPGAVFAVACSRPWWPCWRQPCSSRLRPGPCPRRPPRPPRAPGPRPCPGWTGAGAPPKAKAWRRSSASPPSCRLTTTTPRAARSPSPWPGSRPATQPQDRLAVHQSRRARGSGVDVLLEAGPLLFSDEVRARFDLGGAGLGPVRPGHRPGLRRAGRPDPQPHVDRQRGQGHGPAGPGRRRRKLTYWGHLLRLVSGHDLRQPVPRQRQGPGRGRRPRPHRLVHRTRRPGPPAALLDPAAQRQGRLATLREFLRLCDAGREYRAFSEGNPKRRFDRLPTGCRASPSRSPTRRASW